MSRRGGVAQVFCWDVERRKFADAATSQARAPIIWPDHRSTLIRMAGMSSRRERYTVASHSIIALLGEHSASLMMTSIISIQKY
jgi:hypothetical protein